MKPKAVLRLLPLIIYFFLAAPWLSATPALKGILNLRQPDGTTVQAYITGDEFGHLVRTPDGCVLTQDADGWWCYARFDLNGRRHSSGVRAGAPGAAGSVIAASRDIPFDALARRRKARANQVLPLRRQELARTLRTRAGESTPLRHGLIILAQFPDRPFTYSREEFKALVNNSADPGSAISYFRDQWKDGYTFQFDITPIVTLPNDCAYYGANNDDGEDVRVPQMILDACTAVGREYQFSDYDNDGDGKVDNVFVFYAGPNESEGAGEDFIWPHMWYLQSGGNLTFRRDGVLVDNYACTSELRRDENGSGFTTLATIGTFCHEYTHTFGIPDLYDSDDENSGGYSEALWDCIDLMDCGNLNDNGKTPPNYSAVERWFFEMSEGTPLTEGRKTLRPIEENGDFFYLKTDHPGELFLFECRRNRGWDAFIGGSGLLIYHIDWSKREAGESTSAGKVLTALERWSHNEVNARPEWQCVDLIEPHPESRILYQELAKNRRFDAIRAFAPHVFWPDEDVSLFTAQTDPAFKFHSGEESPYGISDIRVNADGSVSFTVFNNMAEKAPAVKIDRQTVFQDATIIQWSSVVPSFEGVSVIRFGPEDGEVLTEVEVQPYESGKYAFVIEGLKPTTAYKVQLLCRNGIVPGPVNNNASFTTKSDKKAGSYPYIYLKDVERGEDGSFAPDAPLSLRVYNAPDAVGVSWYFDGKPIAPGADGYYHLSRSGVLKAVVTFPEYTDIITKKITVK